MSIMVRYTVVLALGIALGAGLVSMLGISLSSTREVPGKQAEPRYWVAPMDPNFRRDKPGKSPMGMDLVPVFETGEPLGVVEISPQVVNNLGVRTALVSRETLDQSIRAVGYVQYNQDSLIRVNPRVQGWVDKLHVTAAGNPVDLGAPLYDLYSPQLVSAQEEFLSAVRLDSEVLARAARSRLRALQLSDAFITRLERERSVRQIVTFTSPQKGVVSELNIRDGAFVTPGTTLMSIGNLDEVWVEAQVFESQAGLVEVGQSVSMRLDYLPGREWQGEVDYIYPTLDAATRTLRLRLRFRNDDAALRPNMFARVRVHADSAGEVVTVPRQALIRTGREDRVVLALGEGRFKSIAVTMGRTSDDRVEIIQGLSGGEQIVSSAQFLLDSESSKTSDFARMDQDLPMNHQMPMDDDMSMDHDMPGGESHHD